MRKVIPMFLAAITALPAFGQKALLKEMMIRYLPVIICILFSSQISKGQTKLAESKHFDVYVSQEEKSENFGYSMVYGGSPFAYFGNGGGEISFHLADRKKSIYGQYNSSLTRTVYNVVSHGLTEEELEVQLTVQMESTIREYVNIFNGRAKRQTLYWRELDGKTLKPESSKTEIVSKSGKNYSSRGFRIYHAYSPDRTKLVVATSQPENEKSGFRFQVFTGDFDLLWEASHSLNVSEPGIFYGKLGGWTDTPANLAINNEGVVYTLGVNENGKDLSCYLVTINRTNVDYTKLNLGKDPKSHGTLIQTNDGLRVVGFFDNRPDDYVPAQSGFYMVDPMGEYHSQTSFHDFPDDFIKLWWTIDETAENEKEVARGKPGGYRLLELKHVIPNDEGGVTMIAQNGASISRGLGNIVVIDLSSTGEVNWASKVPFSQSGTGTQYIGFGMAATPDKIYFLFNDAQKNANPNWDMKKLHGFDQFANVKDHVATIAICDRNNKGNIIRKQAWTPKEVGGTVSPLLDCAQVGNNWFVHIADGGKNERMVKVVLK